MEKGYCGICANGYQNKYWYDQYLYYYDIIIERRNRVNRKAAHNYIMISHFSISAHVSYFRKIGCLLTDMGKK